MKVVHIPITTPRELGDSFNTIRDKFKELGSCEVVVRELENSRSNAQNRLSFMWYREAHEQLHEYDSDGYRAYCKLHFGVAIRKEKDDFREVYDKIIKPLSYEHKIECMKEPINFPITSEMGVKAMARYLEKVEVHFEGLGAILSKPEDLYCSAMGVKKPYQEKGAS